MNDFPEKLIQSKKYRDVCPDTINRLWSECQAKYKKPKDAEKAVREALHGITGAFLTPAEAAECARLMVEGMDDATLGHILSLHASTRERLPLASMDALYARIFAHVGKTDRILDLACGINPIYLGVRGIKATGVDISGEAVRLINAFRETCGAPVSAICADLLCENAIPNERYDAALLFKALPLLERQRRGAAVDILSAINAAFIVVSFPTRTLGGRNVGMAAHYSEWMEAHMPPNRAISDRFEWENELFYILGEGWHA